MTYDEQMMKMNKILREIFSKDSSLRFERIDYLKKIFIKNFGDFEIISQEKKDFRYFDNEYENFGDYASYSELFVFKFKEYEFPVGLMTYFSRNRDSWSANYSCEEVFFKVKPRQLFDIIE